MVDSDLKRIVALLEERHGVGVRGDELPRWFEERLRGSIQALCVARGLTAAGLLSRLLVEPELVLELANALRVGETRFYRDAAQWEALRAAVLPGMVARRKEGQRLVALSAGCSTGEEAWTLGMLLSEATLRSGARETDGLSGQRSARATDAEPRRVEGSVRARVVGVDRSEAALVTARAGIYDAGSQLQLPRELGQRYLEPAVDGSLKITASLRDSVTFQGRDLTRGAPPGRYAVIVCKNVLIYFGDEAQERLVAELVRALTDDGVLLVARSEVPLLRSLGVPAYELVPGITAFRPR